MSRVPAGPAAPEAAGEVNESMGPASSVGALAELVVAGKVPLPVTHPGLDRDELVRLVLRKRRTHLMAYLAGVLARDIRRHQEPRHAEDDV